MEKKYFCMECFHLVDKLYRYNDPKDSEGNVRLVCKNCLLKKSEEIIESDLMYYSMSISVVEEQLNRLEGYETSTESLNINQIDKEVYYLKQVVIPYLQERLKTIKATLI